MPDKKHKLVPDIPMFVQDILKVVQNIPIDLLKTGKLQKYKLTHGIEFQKEQGRGLYRQKSIT